MENISKRVVPYIIIYVIMTVLLIVFPKVSLALPMWLGMTL
jgi:TRAP-type C4-dicarboxylate transport system permease large subunit